MFHEIAPIISDFKQRLAAVFGEKVHKVVLFGSYSKGSAGDKSDVDIAVVIDAFVDWKMKRQIYDLAFEAGLPFARILHVSVFSRKEFEGRPLDSLMLIESIQHEGIGV